MQTTLRMDDELLRQAKSVAAQQGTSLTAFVEEAIRRLLESRELAMDSDRPQVPVFAGVGGLRPGVDLDNSAGLLEVMERS